MCLRMLPSHKIQLKNIACVLSNIKKKSRKKSKKVNITLKYSKPNILWLFYPILLKIYKIKNKKNVTYLPEEMYFLRVTVAYVTWNVLQFLSTKKLEKSKI